MSPWMFGALMATAIFVPIIGHAEAIAVWLMDFIERMERKSKIEKEKDS